MIETALVFDLNGETIAMHCPPGSTAGSIPDSHDLWSILWENRKRLGGVAHLHPWDGPAWCSQTDVTTFAACEAALGRRLVWPVLTFTDEGHFMWMGPGRLDYVRSLSITQLRDGHRLRELGKGV